MKDKEKDNKPDNREQIVPVDILDVLLDPENSDPITLTDDDGNQLVFEQIAVVPYSGNLYCVLKPLTKIDGVGESEAIVFRVEEAEFGLGLKVEEDEFTAVSVFEEYYKLLENSVKKGGE